MFPVDEILEGLINILFLICYPVTKAVDLLLFVITYSVQAFTTLANVIFQLGNIWISFFSSILQNFLPPGWIAILVAIATVIVIIRVYSLIKGFFWGT